MQTIFRSRYRGDGAGKRRLCQRDYAVFTHPFRGTPAEVMFQHRHAPLPLEKLEHVPRPVLVLIEVLLEKDPARRFQNPADVLNALPKVTEAVKARHTITHQS